MLGWVLSGPVFGTEASESSNVNLNTTEVHTLRIDCKPKEDIRTTEIHALKIDLESQNDIKTIEHQLHKFWNLESLGVINDEKSVIDDVINEIDMNKDNRYEVSLPFKQNLPVIQDNFTTCEKRLLKLHEKLKQNPELLKSYDEIFKEQFKLWIIEKVKGHGHLVKHTTYPTTPWNEMMKLPQSCVSCLTRLQNRHPQNRA